MRTLHAHVNKQTSNSLLNCVYAYVQVHLQTQQKGKIGLIKMGIKVVKSDGIFGLYNGLTASLLRQVMHGNCVEELESHSDCVIKLTIVFAYNFIL